MEEGEPRNQPPKRDLLLEINPCRGTVRIDLLDEDQDEDRFLVTPDIVDVQSLADVERYQCFTFPEEACYDLKIDRISMKKTTRDSEFQGSRYGWSDEDCELGAQIYTLRITTANEVWGDAENVQATIVFSGNPKGHTPDLGGEEFAPDVEGDFVPGIREDDVGTENADVDVGTEDADVDVGTEDADVDVGTEDADVDVGTEDADDDVGTEDAEDDVGSEDAEDDVGAEDDYGSEDDYEYDDKIEEETDDFVVGESDEFSLFNLKNVGKVECIFVTRATDELWQFHEIRVTRVKPKKKEVVSSKQMYFKPVSRTYRRTSNMITSYLS